MVSEEKCVSFFVHMYVHVCSGFVHAHICKGEWLGGWPSHSLSPVLSSHL